MINWIDVVILGIILFSAIVSLMRGFVKEALSLAGWFIAFFVASKYFPYVEPYLYNSIQNDKVRVGVAIGLLFLLTLVVCAIISHIICLIVVKSFISGVDRVLGTIFGVIKGVLIVSILIFFVDKFFPAITLSEEWKDSTFIPHFDVFNRWFFDALSSASDSIKHIENIEV